MAFFKFRKGGGDETQAAAPQAESAESLRRRARHRLIGAAVLVLLGVVGFPLLFDTQPRPIAVDIPIEIPDRNKAKPLPAPAPKAQGAESSVAPVAAKPASSPVAAAPVVPSTPATPAPVVEARKEPAAEAKAEARTAAESPKPEPVQQAKAEAAPARANAEPARPQSLLESKTVQSLAPAPGRYVVQVGAFSDVGKARQARQKVEKAGLKTYTHVADTKDGRRIRVRVGPFATKAEADKAAGRLKELDLPAAILTL